MNNNSINKVFPFLFLFGYLSFTGWYSNLGEARQIARKEHKYILLNFSGSDWCGPCIRMHQEIFDDGYFKDFADSSLVLVNADFPRMKKNQLSGKQQELNNAMADQYNTQGKFPYTVLLNADGKVFKSWEGLPSEKPDAFVMEIKTVINANR
jgi:thioredoxin-related protein